MGLLTAYLNWGRQRIQECSRGIYFSVPPPSLPSTFIHHYSHGVYFIPNPTAGIYFAWPTKTTFRMTRNTRIFLLNISKEILTQECRHTSPAPAGPDTCTDFGYCAPAQILMAPFSLAHCAEVFEHSTALSESFFAV